MSPLRVQRKYFSGFFLIKLIRNPQFRTFDCSHRYVKTGMKRNKTKQKAIGHTSRPSRVDRRVFVEQALEVSEKLKFS